MSGGGGGGRGEGGGGGVVSRPNGQKTAWTTVFFKSSTYFTVYTGGPMVFFTEKTILFQGSIEGPTFSRGGPTFSREGGSEC